VDGLRLQQIKAAPPGVEPATTLPTLLMQNSRPSGGKEIAATRAAGAAASASDEFTVYLAASITASAQHCISGSLGPFFAFAGWSHRSL